MGELLTFPTRYEPYLTRRQVSVLLGCSISTVKNRERDGLPSHLHGGRRMFQWSEVLTYLEQRSA